jgi:hypothetical protein
MSYTEFGERDTCGHGDGHRCGAGGGRTVAQLTVAIETPAVGLTSSRKCAGTLSFSCANCGKRADPTRHCNGDRDVLVYDCTITILPPSIQPPTIGLTSSRKCAGVTTGRYRCKPNTWWHSDCNRNCVVVGEISSANRAVVIVTPTICIATRCNCTSMSVTDINGCERDTDRHAGGHRNVLHIWCSTKS